MHNYFLVISTILLFVIMSSTDNYSEKVADLQELDKSEFLDLMPTSKYLSTEKVYLIGVDENIYCWAGLRSSTSGEIPTTFIKKLKVANYLILVQNNGLTPFTVTPQRINLLLTDGVSFEPFEGEQIIGEFKMFSPRIIELNGKDVSEDKMATTILRQAEFVLMDVSFLVEQTATESSVQEKTDRLEITILMSGKKSTLDAVKF